MGNESLFERAVPLVVYGAGGHGKVVLDIISRLGLLAALLIDDNVSLSSVAGLRVADSAHVDWNSLAPFSFLVAIGDNRIRARIFKQLQQHGGVPRTLVHPFTSVSQTAEVGKGVSVCAGAVINPGATIGDNCIINTSASVDHDCQVGMHCHICPGVRLAGNVRIGDGTMIGTGACVLPGIRLGAGCRIGAGAVVTRDLPADVIACGVPARIKNVQ